jgi:hypothetical protein
MKKITFTFMLAGCAMFAQQNTSYENASINPVQANNTVEEGVIARVDNNRRPVVDSYTLLADFNDGVAENCSDTTLAFEDMVGGPAAITPCGNLISSGGDGCFAAGELEEGFTAEATNAGDIIYIPAGEIGNTDPLVGASAFADFTIIRFQNPTYAVAFDLWENNDPVTIVRVYGDGDVLLETFNATTPTNQQTFFGFIADEVITRVELEGNVGSGELFGNFFFGADCMVLGVNDNLLSQISIFPNPTQDVLNVSVPSTIKINNVVLYDVVGKNTGLTLDNGTINTSSLARGIYILNIQTDRGALTEKIVKQ